MLEMFTSLFNAFESCKQIKQSGISELLMGLIVYRDRLLFWKANATKMSLVLFSGVLSDLLKEWTGYKPGLRSRRILGGVGTGFFLRLRMSNWMIFYITFLNWEFLLKWYNCFWNLLKHISCCAPRFPFITAKFHSLFVKESDIFER